MNEKKALILRITVSYGTGRKSRIAVLSKVTDKSLVLLTDHERITVSRSNHKLSRLHTTIGISSVTIGNEKAFFKYARQVLPFDLKIDHHILNSGGVVEKLIKDGFELYKISEV